MNFCPPTPKTNVLPLDQLSSLDYHFQLIKLNRVIGILSFLVSHYNLLNYAFYLTIQFTVVVVVATRDVEAEAEAGSGGSGKFLWKRKLEAVNGYRFRFH